MWRAPRRWAAFTCTSACCAASSTTIGSGSVASPSASARKPRSTACTATANESLFRNASSGTTRISVGEHALQAALRLRQRLLKMVQLLAVTEPDVIGQTEMIARHEQHAVLGALSLDQLERAHRLAVLHETDGSGQRRVPAEAVSEALQPLLEHGIVRVEDAAGALEQLLAHPRLERRGGEVVAGAGRADGGVVVPRPRVRRERGWCHDPADPQAGQSVRLGQPVDHDDALVAAPERRRGGAVPLSALVDFVR